MTTTAALASSTPTHVNAVDLGLCLLGAEVLRRLNLPCPSDAEVLAYSGFGRLVPDDVEMHSLHLRERIAEYLVEGAFVVGTRRQRTRRR